jgi:hypothetical protein
VALQHHSYFQRQDGNSIADIIDQCIYFTHSSPSTYEIEDALFYDTYEAEILDAPTSSQTLTPKQAVKRDPDFPSLRPLFGWLSTDLIQKTFKSPNPALNIYRLNKDVACDIVYSAVPAIFDGSTAAVIFVGTSTKVTDVHGIKKDNQFANTLEDNIIQ